MLVIEIGIAIVLAVFGAGLGFFVLGASRLGMRIYRDKTSRVSELASGPVELVGELRAIDPVIALDGSRSVVAQRALYYKIRRDDETSESAPVSRTECSPVEVSDESGACLIELEPTLILGHKKHYVFEAERFRELHPKLWSELVRPEAGETVVEVIADEVAVPDGARGFMSGEAMLDDSPERGEARRDGVRRFKLRGGSRRPLIVSSGDKKAVVGVLLRPILRVAWLSLLCWLVAALAIAIPLWLTARAGL